MLGSGNLNYLRHLPFIFRKVDFRYLFCFFLTAFLFSLVSTPLHAKNPFAGYFSNLLDESQAEIAVGNILAETLIQECKDRGEISSSTELNLVVANLKPFIPLTSISYKVMVIKNSIPGEIPFPCGTVFLTTGLLELTETLEERVFLVARNIMHISLRHPILILKREGLYSRGLRLMKKPIKKRDPREAHNLLIDYLKAAYGMNQQKADREGIKLASSAYSDQRKMLISAVGLLKRWSKSLWPMMFLDFLDLPNRIKALETDRMQ